MNAPTTNNNKPANEAQFLAPQDSPRAGGKSMRISDFRDAVDTLNWNRRDLSGATREELLRMDVRTRLQRHIDIVNALLPQVAPRFSEDIRHAGDSLASALIAIQRWQDARDLATNKGA